MSTTGNYMSAIEEWVKTQKRFKGCCKTPSPKRTSHLTNVVTNWGFRQIYSCPRTGVMYHYTDHAINPHLVRVVKPFRHSSYENGRKTYEMNMMLELFLPDFIDQTEVNYLYFLT